MLEMLASGFQVYEVNTGMGALSEVRPDADALSDDQESLILACWVGGRPG
jgi:histidine ammonia-lyase